MKKIIIILIIILVALICGYIVYTYFVTQQQKKIEDQLNSMTTSLKDAGSTIKNDGDSLSNLESMNNLVDEDIAQLKIIEDNSFNNLELKQQEGYIMDTLIYLQNLIELSDSINTMENSVNNLGSLPSSTQLNNLLDECTDILNSSYLSTLKADQYNTHIEEILGISSLPNYQNLEDSLNNEITQINNDIVLLGYN